MALESPCPIKNKALEPYPVWGFKIIKETGDEAGVGWGGGREGACMSDKLLAL